MTWQNAKKNRNAKSEFAMTRKNSRQAMRQRHADALAKEKADDARRAEKKANKESTRLERARARAVEAGTEANNSLAARIAAEFGDAAAKAHAEVADLSAGKRKRSNSNAFESPFLLELASQHGTRSRVTIVQNRLVVPPPTDDDDGDDDDNDDDDDDDAMTDGPGKRRAVVQALEEDGDEAPQLMNADDVPVPVVKIVRKTVKVPKSVRKKIKKMQKAPAPHGDTIMRN